MALPRWIMAPHVDSAAMYSAVIHFRGPKWELWNELELEGELPFIIHGAGEPLNLHATFTSKWNALKECVGAYIFRWLSPHWANKYKELARPGAWLPGEPEWTIPDDCTGRIVRSNGAIVEPH